MHTIIKSTQSRRLLLTLLKYSSIENRGSMAQEEQDSQEKLKQGFRIREEKGNLFNCPETDSLAHCISKDCRMSKGIAVEFKKKYGDEEIKQQQKGVGDVAVLCRENRYIYNLITKVHYHEVPNIGDLQRSVEAMKQHCVDHNVHRLSMPRIGCGLDMQDWGQITQMLKQIFGDTDIAITVYTL